MFQEIVRFTGKPEFFNIKNLVYRNRMYTLFYCFQFHFLERDAKVQREGVDILATPWQPGHHSVHRTWSRLRGQPCQAKVQYQL